MGARLDTLPDRQHPDLTETKPRAASADEIGATDPAIRIVVLALLAVDGILSALAGALLLPFYIGWVVAPQIYFVYDLIQPIVQSGLFNTIDWLSGSITFAQGLSNFTDVTRASINQFINSEFNWIFGTLLPPLPPLPPLFP